MAPRRGRPLPVPEHRVQHGTLEGYHWHKRQRKKDPDHETCPRCKKAWRDYYQAYREKRRRQRARIRQILVGGQDPARLKGRKKDVADIERLINKYATEEEKRELFDD